MELELNGKINETQIYAPAKGTENEEIKKIYIQVIIDKIKEENGRLIIIGDWNGRFGKNKNRGLCCMGKIKMEDCAVWENPERS